MILFIPLLDHVYFLAGRQQASKHIVPITASFILTTFLDTASAYRIFVVRYQFSLFECVPLDSSKSEDMCSEYYVFLTCEFNSFW